MPQAEIVRGLLDEAKASIYRELIERRSKVRYPYFVPATLVMEARPQRLLSIFTRDISQAGVGLLHGMELPLEPGRLTIVRDALELELKIEISWCRPCGDGWFLSGATFRDADG